MVEETKWNRIYSKDGEIEMRDYSTICLAPTKFRGGAGGIKPVVLGLKQLITCLQSRRGNHFLQAKNFPLRCRAKRRAAFSILCVVHEFEAASKRRVVFKKKKKKKGEEVISDMFPGLLFVFDVFS